MSLTLKEAVKHLAASPYPYSLPALRKAIYANKLKTTLVTTDIQKYRVVEVDDLEAWAKEQSKTKLGNPNIRTLRKKAK